MKVFLAFVLLLPSLLLAQNNYSPRSVEYHHGTVGTTAADAITASSVNRYVRGWRICHDSESTATYLAISSGADPLTDGIRIGAGECFECTNCSQKTLIDANVKAQAASTGYSVIMFRE